jgi:hypothetical protein
VRPGEVFCWAGFQQSPQARRRSSVSRKEHGGVGPRLSRVHEFSHGLVESHRYSHIGQSAADHTSGGLEGFDAFKLYSSSDCLRLRSEIRQSMKFYEVTPFTIQLAPKEIMAAATTLTVGSEPDAELRS